MRIQFMASLLLCGFMAAAAPAQVMQLGNVPVQGRAAPASCGCDGFWHRYGPDCGVAGPYADCGGCGACNSCGVGGYFGRNIHPVGNCVCGGSLCLDMIHGIKHLLDKTVSCVVGTVFGGLHAASCHAKGSLAALHCAAMVGCHSCGGSCYGACGAAGYGAMIGSDGYLPGIPTYASPNGTSPIVPEPIEVPEDMEDPFRDDPVTSPEAPQVRRLRRPAPAGYRYTNPTTRVHPAEYQQSVRGNSGGNAVQRAMQSSVLRSSRANSAARNWYLNGRPLTVRR